MLSLSLLAPCPLPNVPIRAITKEYERASFGPAYHKATVVNFGHSQRRKGEKEAEGNADPASCAFRCQIRGTGGHFPRCLGVGNDNPQQLICRSARASQPANLSRSISSSKLWMLVRSAKVYSYFYCARVAKSWCMVHGAFAA